MDTINSYGRILFVLNPISGDISKEEVQLRVKNFCRENLRDLHFFFTSGEGDEEKLAAHYRTLAPELVVAVGGDGTVSLVARVLNHGATPLGIIPLGSGNGLAKDLGIPQEVEGALDLILRGTIRAIDSLEISGEPAFHLADLGFNARIVKLFCEGDTRGPGAYAMIALQEYINYEPLKYKVTTDAEDFEGPAFMLTIANANAFGSNAAINPEGVVDDGFFEICLLEPFPKTAALGILYNLYTDTIQRSLYSRVIKCRQATITREPTDVVQIDGEPVAHLGEQLEIKLYKRSLRVLVPAQY